MAKKKQTAVSDEEVVAAILSNGTIAAAAEACGLAPRTIYDRMKSDDFRAQYAAAKAEVVRGAVYALNKQLTAAVDTVAQIMTDKNVNPATRLQAAQTILSNAAKLSDRLDSGERDYRRISEGADSPLLEALGLNQW